MLNCHISYSPIIESRELKLQPDDAGPSVVGSPIVILLDMWKQHGP